MKLAIATENSMVAAHFGRCSEYNIVEVEDSKVVAREVIANPGHEPGFLPVFLSRQGVSCIIAGGMGSRAQALFAEKNIETYTGITGPVEQALNDYLKGSLKPGKSMCNHRGCS